MENLQFLKQKYQLHTAPEVEQAAKRREARTGEKVPQKPEAKIQNYLERLRELTDREDPSERERGIEALKRAIYIRHVIRPENVPESAYLLEQRIARELGYGDVEITEEFKERKTRQIIDDQRRSLDRWVEYLSSEDAEYPDWAKYWALRSVLEMGQLQKKEDENGKEIAYFKKRRKDTTASFAPLNPRALAMTIGALRSHLEQKNKPKEKRETIENLSKKLSEEEFQKLVSTEEFSKIYSQFLLEIPEYSTEGLRETRGEWVKYEKNSDPAPLVNSLDGYPLEWCTANIDTARTQLQGGDFYVYYSIDENGEAKIPRLAIRMQGDSIAELRGIAPNQNIDPYIADVAKKKMKEFPDGEIYEKKSDDMKRLTLIEEKTKAGQPLTKDELIFLYEIDQPIQGFGYQKDPRIQEIRDQRNPKEDVFVALDCDPDQIAWSRDQINENTKAYIGLLYPNIFQELYDIEHIYTSFPEGKIRKTNIEIGGKDKNELLKELREKKIGADNFACQMMENRDFIISKKKESVDLIRLKVGDLGISRQNPTTEEIFEKAKELGLELCPPETGLQYRLQYTDQPLGECFWIGMKQISSSEGSPDTFRLVHNGGGLWLYSDWVRRANKWRPSDEFVFRLRKFET